MNERKAPSPPPAGGVGLSFPGTGIHLPSPPETEVQMVEETLHGVVNRDPYRWLEGSAAPELAERSGGAGEPDLDEPVAAWTAAQNAYTRSVLDALPGREKLEGRLRELMEIESLSLPVPRRDRYFYLRQSGSHAQSVLYLRHGTWGEPRVLLDPNHLDPTGLTTLDWFEPNYDGTLLAFGLSRGGDENSTLSLLQVESGQWLADEIAGRVGEVDWLPDSSGFFYSALRDLDDPYSREIKFHVTGTHPRHDPVLFSQYREGPLATTWGPFAYLSYEGRWLMVGYWTGTASHDLWVVDVEAWRQSGVFERREVMVGRDAVAAGPVLGDTLYARTSLDAPNHRVVAVDLKDPAPEAWVELVPENESAALSHLHMGRGVLLTHWLQNACSHLELYGLDGSPRGEVELPDLGMAQVSTWFDRSEAFFSFESFHYPRTLYWLDLESGERREWERPRVPVDPSTVEVRQVRYPSRDGTSVSMFIVHRQDLPADGPHPTLLTGYGGFNISRTPSFLATLFPWLEAGGVFALPNLRGGGEYGETWHRAGMLEKKQNVFDDFLCAAEWLIDQGYTAPRRLAIAGGSNGGLLTAAAMTQRPDLFACVLCAVPLLDMVRYHHFLMARFWVPEYGSSEDPEQLAYLLRYSPYHNVDAGTEYPPVLFTTAENDTRVHPLHARKMAALLQATRSSHPVLLWVDQDAGHGPGKPLHRRVRDVADQRIFLMACLGMLAGESPRGE